MEILFLWLRQYGPIEKQLFVFSNELRFRVEEKQGREMVVHVEDNKAHIHGLWSNSIASISGIFGQNGTGKTTILDWISSNLPDGAGQLGGRFVMGIRDGNQHAIWTLDQDAHWTVDDSASSKTFDVISMDTRGRMATDIVRRNTSIIYYTPNHWPLDPLRELAGPYTHEHGFHNLSTSYLLQHDAISFANSEHPIKAGAPGPGQVLAHRFQSWKREMSFLASEHAVQLKFPPPEHVSVSPNTYEEGRLVADAKFKKLLDPFVIGQNSGTVADYRRSFKDSVYRAMVLNMFYTEREASWVTDPQLTSGLRRDGTMADWCRTLLHQVQKAPATLFRDKAEAMLEFMDYVEGLDDSILNIRSLGGAQIPVELGQSSALAEFFFKYSKTILITDYLIFSWDRRLSSGEQSLLTLYARLWMLADKPATPSREPARNVKLRRNVILLLDEADSFFHPEWQKGLYKRLIEFVPRIYGNRKIQIILAANNPFQLSDMFRYQANMYRSRGVLSNEPSLLPHTFAGNIHYLMADSFFMGKSLIGTFAEEKLREVIRWLRSKTRKRIDTHAKWLTEDTADRMIEQIGEPVLKEKLRDMLCAKFPRHLEATMIERRLREMESRRSELEAQLQRIRKNNSDSHSSL